jgi:3-hydroxy-9,10-secoandrosta-1,3,5(10)-triene-9,17-dione monooxygenase reductase component
MNENKTIFKQFMSNFTTGVCVLTVFEEREDINNKTKFSALTINSFNSVSLDPQLILYNLGKSNSNFELFLNAKYFYINILSYDQINLSNFFAYEKDYKDFSNFSIKSGNNNEKFVILNDCIAGVACEKYCDYEGGDHQIILGKPIFFDFFDHEKKKKPLVYFQSQYRDLK